MQLSTRETLARTATAVKARSVVRNDRTALPASRSLVQAIDPSHTSTCKWDCSHHKWQANLRHRRPFSTPAYTTRRCQAQMLQPIIYASAMDPRMLTRMSTTASSGWRLSFSLSFGNQGSPWAMTASATLLRPILATTNGLGCVTASATRRFSRAC